MRYLNGNTFVEATTGKEVGVVWACDEKGGALGKRSMEMKEHGRRKRGGTMVRPTHLQTGKPTRLLRVFLLHLSHLVLDPTKDCRCLFYNKLDGYPASLGFPIMHQVHAICTQSI